MKFRSKISIRTLSTVMGPSNLSTVSQFWKAERSQRQTDKADRLFHFFIAYFLKKFDTGQIRESVDQIRHFNLVEGINFSIIRHLTVSPKVGFWPFPQIILHYKAYQGHTGISVQRQKHNYSIDTSSFEKGTLLNINCTVLNVNITVDVHTSLVQLLLCH
jgi:hypothetical protein